MDPSEVLPLADLAATLIKLVVDLVGVDRAKAALDPYQTQAANMLADEAERLKFGRSSSSS